MKRLTCFAMILLLVLLAGCGPRAQDTTTFTATVVETHYNYLIVEPDPDSDVYSYGDRIEVSFRVMDDDLWNELGEGLATGDLVEVTFSGDVQATDPPQIVASYITVLSPVGGAGAGDASGEPDPR